MQFLLSLSLLALALSTQLRIEENDLLDQVTSKFDQALQEVLGEVYFSMDAQLQEDWAASDVDETEALQAYRGDALLQSLAKAGEQLSQLFEKSLSAFADKQEGSDCTVAETEALQEDKELGGHIAPISAIQKESRSISSVSLCLCGERIFNVPIDTD